MAHWPGCEAEDPPTDCDGQGGPKQLREWEEDADGNCLIRGATGCAVGRADAMWPGGAVRGSKWRWKLAHHDGRVASLAEAKASVESVLVQRGWTLPVRA